MLGDLLLYASLALVNPKMAMIINRADHTSQIKVKAVAPARPDKDVVLIKDPHTKK